MKTYYALPKSAFPLLAAFVPQFFAVLGFLLAARCLDTAALAAWAMFLTLASFAEMARQGLVQSALVHFSARFPAGEKMAIWSAALVWTFATSIVGAVAIGLAATVCNRWWHLPGLVELSLLFPIVALALAPLRWHDAVRLSEQDFRGVAIAALIFGLSYLLFLGLGHYFSGKTGVLQLLFWQMPAGLLTAALRARDIWRRAHRSGNSKRRRSFWFRKFWRYGRYGLGSNLLSMLFQRADVLLLAAFVAPTGLAAYHVASRIVTWLDFPLNALSQAFLPKMAAAFMGNGQDGVRSLYRQSVGRLWGIAAILATGAIIGADWLVGCLGGGKYAEAVVLLRILLLAAFAKPFGRMLGTLLDATGRPAANFRMVGLSLLLNLSLLFLLLPRFGVVGAAVASTGGIFLTTALGQYCFRKLLWPFSSVFMIIK